MTDDLRAAIRKGSLPPVPPPPGWYIVKITEGREVRYEIRHTGLVVEPGWEVYATLWGARRRRDKLNARSTFRREEIVQ